MFNNCENYHSMKKYFISEDRFINFVEKNCSHIPCLKGNKQYIGVNSEKFSFYFNPYRISSPFIKSILFEPREKTAPLQSGKEKKNLIFGLKACDLASLPIMDYVFNNGDFIDPLYKDNRENTIIISSDCTDCLETCFCTLIGNNPYPEKNFDINVSPIRDGYILTIATDKGEEIIDKKLLQEPTENQIKMAEIGRKNIKDKVDAQVSKQGYNVIANPQNAVMNNFDSKVWEESAETCVECGGCNLVCPTCHCFILSEHSQERYRQWDACQYKGFAQVAGGANPRKKLHQRLRNRYIKKFDFFQKNIGLYACTGCGRCIQACIGKIDMRDVLKRLMVKS